MLTFGRFELQRDTYFEKQLHSPATYLKPKLIRNPHNYQLNDVKYQIGTYLNTIGEQRGRLELA